MQLDRLDADLEHLPGLGAAHRDRPGEDVRAAELRLHLVVDRRQRRRHGRGPIPASAAAPSVPDTVEIVTVSPEFDGEQRLERRVEIAPVHGVGRSVQAMRGHVPRSPVRSLRFMMTVLSICSIRSRSISTAAPFFSGSFDLLLVVGQAPGLVALGPAGDEPRLAVEADAAGAIRILLPRRVAVVDHDVRILADARLRRAVAALPVAERVVVEDRDAALRADLRMAVLRRGADQARRAVGQRLVQQVLHHRRNLDHGFFTFAFLSTSAHFSDSDLM